MHRERRPMNTRARTHAPHTSFPLHNLRLFSSEQLPKQYKERAKWEKIFLQKNYLNDRAYEVKPSYYTKVPNYYRSSSARRE